MRLSDLILAGKALLRKSASPEAEEARMPERKYKGVVNVKIPNGTRKRFGMAKR